MKELNRGAGILLSITSLPSAYGIGTLGKEAYQFIDLLVDLRQKYWQVLPLGPTSYGDSPYQSFSAFAGNPYLIDLEALVHNGLLTLNEINSYSWGSLETDIDYAALFENRFKILRTAYSRFRKDNKRYSDFLEETKYWIDDYGLFMAVKEEFSNREWQHWNRDIRDREEAALDKYKKKLAEQVDFWQFCQYMFFTQWEKLKRYANERGIEIIGEVPHYVSSDSVDVWAHREWFLLDASGKAEEVAGCPPDALSTAGQRWGNPLYDWDTMEKDDFSWWRQRIQMNSKLYDVLRINHFVGFVKYYSVPADNQDGNQGRWHKGPGKKLLDVIDEESKDTIVIAEDFGTVVVPVVRKLMSKVGWAGMRVLLFAFDGDTSNPYLPHNYEDKNTVVYGTTHDSDTLVGYFKDKSDYQLAFLYEYLGIHKKEEIPDAFIRLAYSSIADVVILQMQDILKLGNEARMNLPSTVGQNWRWRLWHDAIDEDRRNWLRTLATIYRR